MTEKKIILALIKEKDGIGLKLVTKYGFLFLSIINRNDFKRPLTKFEIKQL